MEPKDFDEGGYSCMPLDVLTSEAWRDKPESEWTEEDYFAFHYQDIQRLRESLMDIALDID